MRFAGEMGEAGQRGRVVAGVNGEVWIIAPLWAEVRRVKRRVRRWWRRGGKVASFRGSPA